jgi:hypothetical protein
MIQPIAGNSESGVKKNFPAARISRDAGGRLNKRNERQVITEFQFEDNGHKFSCATETPRHVGLQPWWWFTLDGDKTTRYAPFEKSADDTEQSVKARIILYYSELLAIRARPYRDRSFWRKAEPVS